MIKQSFSKIFFKNLDALNKGYRNVVNQGGTSSTKTYSILQLLILLAYSDKSSSPIRIDIVGQTVPHLINGVVEDSKIICDSFGIDFYENYNKTRRTLTFGKNQIKYLSFKDIGAAHGGRREYLYINEANYHIFKIVEQLISRTSKTIFIDFNPSLRFWAHDLADNRDDSILIKSTFRDNPFLDKNIVNEIVERGKRDQNFWRVYGLGEIGIAEGLVFDNFEIQRFDKSNFESTYIRHGNDWGFSNDPFCYIRLAINKKKKEIYILDEVYDTQLTNEMAVKRIKSYVNNDILFSGFDEPKSIEEFNILGINSVSAGAKDVRAGIKFLQSYKIIIHQDCVNTYKEFCGYSWKENQRTGKQLPVPQDEDNHAIDAIRYALTNDINYTDFKFSV